MNLHEALEQIVHHLGYSADEFDFGKAETQHGALFGYAEEDTVGGWHPDPALRKWPVGSVFEAEGKVLYALTRALRPQHCVEIGIQDGCSASHIAAALKANGSGHLTSIDRGNSGALIPDELRSRVVVTGGDGAEWLAAQPDDSVDFLFEDADHSEDLSYRVGGLVKTRLRPGGLFVAHDAAHFLVGQGIRAGYTRAGLDYRVFEIESSDCGLLIWRRPGQWLRKVDAAAKKPAAKKPKARKA